ncbi:MAG: NAD+ synthase [Desulfovibrio sp.]|nr:NAD+ synthase [Desulfovibrio sp.]
MQCLRLALCQINPTVGDISGNTARMAAFIRAAARAGAQVAVFPEMAVSGYPPEDLLLSPHFLDAARAAYLSLARVEPDMTVIFGAPACPHDVANAALVAHGGRIAAAYHKRLLPNYGVFDEHRYFRAGDRNLILGRAGFHIGVSVCEDIWYPDGPAAMEAAAGATLLVNISASPYHLGKGAARERMLAVRAADSRAYVAYCNLVGGQDELVFDGRALVFSPSGETVARGAAFREELILADLDPSEVRRARLADPRDRLEVSRAVFEDTDRVDLETPAPGVVKGEGAPDDGLETPVFPECPEPSAAMIRTAIAGVVSPPAEVYAALVLGLGDYVRKSGFSRVVIGLSGGIDSSLTAALAADALGPGQVLGVAMPTRYSSAHSLEDARELAANLGISFQVVSVDGVFQAFLDALAEPFAGRKPDVTEENLQSRARGTLLMALANKFISLVITTGNKSETAVGYSTLYGDTAGGFAVIKDVPKTLVYTLSGWRNAAAASELAGLGFSGPAGAVIPGRVLTKPPSAELRPGQLDADSLPPYDVLDAILADHVERGLGLEDMAARGRDPETVRRVLRMVGRSEYKRRQSPPGVKITPRAFGKDWRLPLAGRTDGLS